MSAKEHIERSYLNLFIEKTLSSKNIETEKSEAPDFLLKIEGKTIGIEVTEPNVPSLNFPNRQIESIEDFITGHASKLANEKGLPFLSVWLFFNIQQRLTDDQQRAIAQAVTNTVEEAIPAINGRIKLEYPFSSKIQPREVDLIHIARNEHAKRQWWRPVRTSEVLKNASDLFQGVIHQKGKKYSSYREQCDECWLLLGAEGTRQSSAIRPNEATLSYLYQSEFERVFFVRLVDEECHELQLTRSEQIKESTKS